MSRSRPCLTWLSAATAVLALTMLSGCFDPPPPDVTIDQSDPPSIDVPDEPDEAALKLAQQLTVRVENVSCSASDGSGSGFLVDPTHVVTAYHVVVGAREPLAVRPSFGDSGFSTSAGRVVGFDPQLDVALIELRKPLNRKGMGLENAEQDAVVGQEVHEIGYPLGRPKESVDGEVLAWAKHVGVSGGPGKDVVRYIPEAFKISAESRPGNSGGPVVDNAGEVVGMLDAGPETNEYGVVVPASAFSVDRLTSWKANPLTLDPCQQDDDIDLVLNDSGNPDSAALRVFLNWYLGALNDAVLYDSDEAFERARDLTRGDLKGEELGDFKADNFGREYSNVVIECTDTISSTTDKVNISYDEDVTTPDGETSSHHRERVVTADIKDGTWKFSKNEPFEGDDIGDC